MATFQAPIPAVALAVSGDGRLVALAGYAEPKVRSTSVLPLKNTVGPCEAVRPHRRKGANVALVITAQAPMGEVRQELTAPSRWDVACVEWNPHASQRHWIATAVRIWQFTSLRVASPC